MLYLSKKKNVLKKKETKNIILLKMIEKSPAKFAGYYLNLAIQKSKLPGEVSQNPLL